MPHYSGLRTLAAALVFAPALAQAQAPSRAAVVARLDSIAESGVKEGRVVGLSVAVIHGSDTLLHGGSIEGFVPHASWYPEQRVAVVVLMNSTGSMSPATLASEPAMWVEGLTFRSGPNEITFDTRKAGAPVLHVSGSSAHYVLKRQ